MTGGWRRRMEGGRRGGGGNRAGGRRVLRGGPSTGLGVSGRTRPVAPSLSSSSWRSSPIVRRGDDLVTTRSCSELVLAREGRARLRELGRTPGAGGGGPEGGGGRRSLRRRVPDTGTRLLQFRRQTMPMPAADSCATCRGGDGRSSLGAPFRAACATAAGARGRLRLSRNFECR
ncbi:hypothetical protein FQN60_007029 [Etheostoma spectabile]|uniref:Uncharacterized protein n=1 Tax=Etheostoma spectabile TaxID=54343 RepID=A0A5J5CEY8_9PERO|nr:hypothetical protein FQN60_007029 [Etheostoma spectabile]